MANLPAFARSRNHPRRGGGRFFAQPLEWSLVLTPPGIRPGIARIKSPCAAGGPMGDMFWGPFAPCLLADVRWSRACRAPSRFFGKFR